MSTKIMLRFIQKEQSAQTAQKVQTAQFNSDPPGVFGMGNDSRWLDGPISQSLSAGPAAAGDGSLGWGTTQWLDDSITPAEDGRRFPVGFTENGTPGTWPKSGRRRAAPKLAKTSTRRCRAKRVLTVRVALAVRERDAPATAGETPALRIGARTS